MTICGVDHCVGGLLAGGEVPGGQSGDEGVDMCQPSSLLLRDSLINLWKTQLFSPGVQMAAVV